MNEAELHKSMPQFLLLSVVFRTGTMLGSFQKNIVNTSRKLSKADESDFCTDYTSIGSMDHNTP